MTPDYNPTKKYVVFTTIKLWAKTVAKLRWVAAYRQVSIARFVDECVQKEAARIFEQEGLKIPDD